MKSARVNHGVIKDHFLVDIGVHELNPKLREDLQKYNSHRSLYAIKRLWVLHSDGTALKEISLA